MGPVASFIIALAVAATSLAGGSLVWPRLTTNERPKLLQEVHDVVIKTQQGQEAAQVLGVSDEKNVKPIQIGQVVGGVVGGVTSALQNRARDVIVGNAVNQLRSEYDKMPKNEKDAVQQIFCQTPTTSTSSSEQKK